MWFHPSALGLSQRPVFSYSPGCGVAFSELLLDISCETLSSLGAGTFFLFFLCGFLYSDPGTWWTLHAFGCVDLHRTHAFMKRSHWVGPLETLYTWLHHLGRIFLSFTPSVMEKHFFNERVKLIFNKIEHFTLEPVFPHLKHLLAARHGVCSLTHQGFVCVMCQKCNFPIMVSLS